MSEGSLSLTRVSQQIDVFINTLDLLGADIYGLSKSTLPELVQSNLPYWPTEEQLKEVQMSYIAKIHL